MKKIKAAIIGCGRVSVRYGEAFRHLAGQVELVYAVDKDRERARKFAESFGCAYTDRFEDILHKGIDVLHICLPHYLHASVAIQAMEAGIHVLTEKPMAMSLQEADEMLLAQGRTGMKLGVIFQTRYARSVRKLREMVAAGDFGRILSARSFLTWSRPRANYQDSDWKGTWDREGGGVLMDQAIHSIDRIRYVLGSEAEWVDGSIHNYAHGFVEVEDTACAAIMFRNGCLYHVYACNTYGANAPVSLEFIGERGRCGLVRDQGYYELEGHYTELNGSCELADAGPGYWGSSHHMQLKDFYRCVQEDLPVSVDGLEGRKSLEIVKGIYLASARRERISFPFEDVLYRGLGQPW